MPTALRTRGARVSSGARRAAGALAWLLVAGSASAQGVPTRLADGEFWRLVTELSEPGGFFRSDNFVSNETSFQTVIPELERTLGTGGVYLGVGPEQNFTYIAALRPRIAFVLDIRRQNMLEHLVYKALLEQSSDRADFLARLFSRPRPRDASATTPADSMLEAFARVEPDSARYRTNLASIIEQLTVRHRFPLGEEDRQTIAYIYGAFFEAGPEISYSFPARGSGMFGRRWMPTFAMLMSETDARGRNRSFLASEESFLALRELEARNLIVPIVGDFAGDKALRAIGRYLAEHGATVSVFYTSNVEQYLFQQADAWARFFGNVASLPIDERSTFVRAAFNSFGYRDPSMPAGPRSRTLLASIAEQLRAFDQQRIQSYFDVIQLSREPVPPE